MNRITPIPPRHFVPCSALVLLLAGSVAGGLAGCGGGGGGSTVVDPASITAQPADVAVLAGQAAGFSVTAQGAAPLSYQWLRDGTPIPGATSPGYSLAEARLADSGAKFSVEVSNGGGKVTSTAATLTVQAVPTVSIATQPQAASANAGATATFSVVASVSDGSTPLSYQWLRDGTAIAGATGPSYTTPVLTPADNGARFTVRIGAGSATPLLSAEAVLAVTATGPVALSAGRYFGLALKSDGSVIMLGTGEGAMPQTARTAVPNSHVFTVSGLQARALSAGNDRALAVGTDGKLYGWGLDTAGTLGGNPLNHVQATARVMDGVDGLSAALVAGAYSLALRSDGSVWHWPGRIGYSPESVVPLAVPGLSDAKKLFGGKSTIADYRGAPFVLRADGSVWQLSWTITTSAGSGGAVQTHTGTATQLAGLADVVDVTCTAHCLALLADGRVKAWGPNAQGQLGNGQSGDTTEITAPVLVQQATAVPGITQDFSGVRAVATTMLGSIAVMQDGRVFSWGSGYNGRGDVTDNPPLPALLPLPTGSALATDIACANQLCLLLLADGSVLSWGANGSGELGDGTSFTRNTPVAVPGLNLKLGAN